MSNPFTAARVFEFFVMLILILGTAELLERAKKAKRNAAQRLYPVSKLDRIDRL